MELGEGVGYKLEIFLTARSLGNMDFFSKSDPYVKVYFKATPQGLWGLIGRTETVNNNLNPDWGKSFVLDYYFESKQ